MKTVLLSTVDALEPEADPVIGQVTAALESLGHSVEKVAVGDRIEPVIEPLRNIEPDLVFNLAEHFAGKSALDSSVAALLTLMDLRYTGASQAGLLLAGDKALAKKILSFHGIRTPEFATLHRGAVGWAGDIDFPLIVKPPLEDGSIGLHTRSVVNNVQELLASVDEIHSKHRQPVLIEQYVDGREFYVGVIGNAEAEALPIVELDFSGFPADRPKIASWEAKWGDETPDKGQEFAGTRSVIAKDLDDELSGRIHKVAVDSFRALQLRDYGRVDLRVTNDGQVFVIEVNPNCYLEKESEFARSAAESGLQYEALIGRIAELALARYAR